MKPKFSINNVDYFFEDISLRRFNAIKPYVIEETTTNKLEIISILSNCPVSELRKLPYDKWAILWDEAIFHITFYTSVDGIEPKFEFNGVEYALSNIEDISIGEFIDLDLILQGNTDDKTMAHVASILYRPVVKKLKHKLLVAPYDPEEAQYRAEEFLDLPIRYIKSANAFFLTSAQALQKNLLDSLDLKKTMENLSQSDLGELENLLQQDLGGWSSTEFQEKISSIFQELQNSQSEQYSIGWLGKKLRLKGKHWNKSK